MTNQESDELEEAGREFLEAGRKYSKMYHRYLADRPSAVVWMESEGGALVVWSRSEYKETLLANIEYGMSIPQAYFSDTGTED